MTLSLPHHQHQHLSVSRSQPSDRVADLAPGCRRRVGRLSGMLMQPRPQAQVPGAGPLGPHHSTTSHPVEPQAVPGSTRHLLDATPRDREHIGRDIRGLGRGRPKAPVHVGVDRRVVRTVQLVETATTIHCVRPLRHYNPTSPPRPQTCQPDARRAVGGPCQEAEVRTVREHGGGLTAAVLSPRRPLEGRATWRRSRSQTASAPHSWWPAWASTTPYGRIPCRDHPDGRLRRPDHGPPWPLLTPPGAETGDPAALYGPGALTGRSLTQRTRVLDGRSGLAGGAERRSCGVLRPLRQAPVRVGLPWDRPVAGVGSERPAVRLRLCRR